MKIEAIVPDYFEKFACKCSECRNPCCDGWGISLSEHEYFSLLGLDCSKRLRNKLDDAIVINGDGDADEYAHFEPNYLERCPMLDDDGLCLLQKEKGENVLPLVCRLYPRSLKKYGDIHELCMSGSCEKTIELLFDNDKPLKTHCVVADFGFDGLPEYDSDGEKDKLRRDVFTVMASHGGDISERLSEIGFILTKEKNIAEKSRRKSLDETLSLLSRIAKISESIGVCKEKVFDYLDPDVDDYLSKFTDGEKKLFSVYPCFDTFLGNLLANHMMYEGFPFVFGCRDLSSAFASLCSVAAIIRLIAVCSAGLGGTEDDVISDISEALRYFEHSNYYEVSGHFSEYSGMYALSVFAPLLERE